MSCTDCKHYRQKRGCESGLMECAALVSGIACNSCYESFPIMDWAHAAVGFIRCPKCCKAKRMPANDSPLVGFLGVSTDPPAWCPGREPIEKPKERDKPDPQRTLF